MGSNKMYFNGKIAKRAWYGTAPVKAMYYQGKKIFPPIPTDVTVTQVVLVLTGLPSTYDGATKRADIPACGATTEKCIVTYTYINDDEETVTKTKEVKYNEGSIRVASKGAVVSGASYITTMSVTFTAENKTIVTHELSVMQEANAKIGDLFWKDGSTTQETRTRYDKPVITSFTYLNIAANGTGATPGVVYKQDKIADTYNITEELEYQKYTSGDHATGSKRNKEALASSKVTDTITTGGTLTFGGYALNSSEGTIASDGKVTCKNRYRTEYTSGDVFYASVYVTLNGLTSDTAYAYVKQDSNTLHIEVSSTTKIKHSQDTYGTPLVTLTYKTGSGDASSIISAAGGTLYPAIYAKQTYSTYSYYTHDETTWKWWDADTVGLKSTVTDIITDETTVDHNDVETTDISKVVAFSSSNESRGASISTTTGEVTGKNLGTTAYSEGNILYATAVVKMNGKSGNGSTWIRQKANTKSVSSSSLTGIYGLSLKKLDGSEVLITEELSYTAQGLLLNVEGKRTIKYSWSSGSSSSTNESVANVQAESVTSSKTAMLAVGSYDADRGYALMLTSNSSKTEARSVVVTVKLGIDTVTRTIYQGVNTEVEYAKNYFRYKFVKTSDFTTPEGDILPVGNIVLDRTNKPGNVGYVVNYTITYEVHGGNTYTKTGTVTLTSDMTEGTEAATAAKRLVAPLVTSYSDY